MLNSQSFNAMQNLHTNQFFYWERLLKDRFQYGLVVAPLQPIKRLPVRDARGSYIMFTGPLLYAPLTDTLTRHFDTMTK